MNNIEIKKELISQCYEFIEKRITNARLAMHEAQYAANEETKGSVGDKHETGRAMMQIERDKHARMLADAIEQKNNLDRIDISVTASLIRSGSLVLTSEGNFFISIGVGKLIAQSIEVYAVAATSPIGALFIGKKKGEGISLNNRNYVINEIA